MLKEFKPKGLSKLDFEKSKPIAKWMGEHLKKLRGEKDLKSLAKNIARKAHPAITVLPGSKTIESVKEMTDRASSDLSLLENGDFHFKSGRLYQLLEEYNVTLTKLLEKSISECEAIYRGQEVSFDDDNPYKRQSFYSLRLKSGRLPATPLFVAGDPEKFLWAVPLRRLETDRSSVELLELAEMRFRKPDRGKTFPNAHQGSEVIFIIRGKVEQHIQDETGHWHDRKMFNGDLVHFNSSRPHYVENTDAKTTALLLITRIQ